MKIRNLTDIKSFLFDHQTVGQTIFKNTFWLGLAEGVSRVATFILFIYVARILGATEYGKFSFALAIISLGSILPGFVSADIVTREFAQEREKEKEFSSIFSLKILLGLVTIFLLMFISFFVSQDIVIRKVIWILSVYWIFNSLMETFYAFFRARQRMEYESFFKVFDALLTASLGLFVIFKLPSIENLSYAYLAEGFILLAILLLFFHFKIYRLRLSWNGAIWKKILSFSWPMALTGVVAGIYSQIDVVMMGSFNQLTQTGWYNAAFRITRLALVPMALVSQSFYPVLSRFFTEQREGLGENWQKTWNHQMKIMTILAIPLTVGGIVLAPKIIDFFYGQSYASSILAFQLLMVMTGIIFLYESFRQTLIISHLQRKIFWVVLSGAAINIVLNFILIPKFSLYGAALATVVTNIVIFSLFLKFTLKYTALNPFNPEISANLIRVLISGGIMYLAISRPFVYNLPVIVSISIGTAVYFTALFVLIRRLNFNLKQRAFF